MTTKVVKTQIQKSKLQYGSLHTDGLHPADSGKKINNTLWGEDVRAGFLASMGLETLLGVPATALFTLVTHTPYLPPIHTPWSWFLETVIKAWMW